MHERLRIDLRLQLAAQWHTNDALQNRALNADIGSDGSTGSDRAVAAGFRGDVAETVAINPALAISGIELINQWYSNPNYLAIMGDCKYTAIGVWSENSLDRTVARLRLARVTDHRPTETGPIGVHTRETGFPTRAQPRPVAV